MKAIAIILAAGESRRMGVPKALLEAPGGVTFLGRLVTIFEQAGLAPLVVVGAHAAEIQAAHPEVRSVLNPRWPEGQLSSVFVGLRAALVQGAERILIHPVDVPMIGAPTAARVLEALARSPAIVPRCEGKPGHPLGLVTAAARTLLGSTARTLEEGAALLEASGLVVEDPQILDNLNTPEAYLRRFGRAPGPVTSRRGSAA